jgi:hypothetical protein
VTCIDAADKPAGLICAKGAADTAIDGFFYDTTKGFVVCNANCKTCKGAAATDCKSCATTTITGYTDPVEGAANYDTLLKIKVFNSTTGECYTACPAGWKVEDAATRISCVEDSNSVILSAIALIFSLFLIF